LLKDGKAVVNATAEGSILLEPFYYNFGVRRHPRTIAGTTPDGKIIIVVVDDVFLCSNKGGSTSRKKWN
jgi:hypothetical protein